MLNGEVQCLSYKTVQELNRKNKNDDATNIIPQLLKHNITMHT